MTASRLLLALPGLRGAAAAAAAAPAAVAKRALATHHGGSGDGGECGGVYVLFGATGGIGTAVAHRLAAAMREGRPGGDRCLLLSARDEGRLAELARRLERGRGGAIEVAPADALNPEAVDAVFQRALRRHGRVDGAACCAGSVEARSLLATPLAALDSVLRDNLHTAFSVLQGAVKAMLCDEARRRQRDGGADGGGRAGAGGGSVVLVSAAAAGHGIPNYSAFSAAKAGVEGLMRSTAATYAPHGLRVNCVAPGLVRTRQTKAFFENARVKAASEAMHPAKHAVDADDVAAAVEFLLTSSGRSVTGQVLGVDGGLSQLAPERAQDYGV